MTTPNILTDTTPVRDEQRSELVHSIITDAWGLYFAQGGVVMAAATRAMELVLERDDLTLASASATFCRPVACGPVTTVVDVLRSGRRGAQVHATLRDATAPEGEASVVITAVFTDPTMAGPSLSLVPRPDDLLVPPPADLEPEPFESEFPLGFLDNTQWQHATDPAALEAALADPAAGPRPNMAVWFRFTDPPAAEGQDWDPALLPIPGDALGTALSVALAGGDEPIGSVSLQIGLQVFAPMRGTWIGVDSWCSHVGNGLANGPCQLWSDQGVHVATVTQTAMLRSFGG
ncbi:MAG: thioesterase family protein [Acidimicrobiales bacterium]|mgnify:CR=1 FL=1|nr:thioesterase family protein [Acidimicrobiales bacterium]